MATQVQFRGGTTSQHGSFTGAVREVTVDTDKETLVVHDGSTAGGFEISRADASNLTFPNGTNSAPSITFSSDANTGIYRGGTDILKFVTAGTDAITIDASQNVTMAGTVTGVTNLGVNGTGTSSFTSTATTPLQINGTSIPTLTVRNSTTPVELQMRATTTEGLVRTSTNHPLVFATNASERMRIDSSGNVGIGVVPNSSWHSTLTALQIGGNASLSAQSSVGASKQAYFSQNVFNDGDQKYISTDEASNYRQQGGTHIFEVAASGSANAVIS